MKKETKKAKPAGNKTAETNKDVPLTYPPSQDIYSKSKELSDVDPEDTCKRKTRNVDEDKPNELDFEDDRAGDDLDVPGAELDDKEERNGNEDEENNYYSLGGDDHNDLEEDKGD